MRCTSARFAGVLAVLLLGAPAAGVPLGFTGSLTLEVILPAVPPLPIPLAGTASVSGPATFSITAGGAFATTGLDLLVTNPAAHPIKGMVVTVANGTGSFVAGSGLMPLPGTLRVCLFTSCSTAVANLVVPLAVVGAGGTQTVVDPSSVNLTVVGAPWTLGTAAVGFFTGAITRMGATSGGGAVPGGSLTYVTPLFVSSSIPGDWSVIPVFATLELAFVPEPGTLALVGAGIAALAACGRTRRARRR